MKQKYKRVLGVVGLVAVVAITAFAASLPAPETQAASSITDEITVRVVDEEAELYASDRSVDTNKLAKITFNYGKILTLHLKVIYNEGQATEAVVTLPDVPAGYDVVSSLPMQLNLITGEYAYNNGSGVTGNLNLGANKYGKYKIYAWGSGSGTGEKSASTEFEYTEDGEVIPVPDTGIFTSTNNLMKKDYLITGLIIFLLVGISGFMFISGREKSTRKRRK